MAMERTALIHQAHGDIKELYGAQSALLNALEARKNQPSEYQLNARPEVYQNAAEKIRLDRANLILKHRDGVLQDHKVQATQDYEHLDRVEYQNRRYRDEISVLRNSGSTVSGFNPAVLENTVIHTTPEFGLVDTQAHDSTPPTGEVTVVVIPYRVSQQRFDQVLSKLKIAEYKVNREKSRILNNALNQPPAAVMYYNQNLAEQAKRLAQSMHNWTDLQFRAIYVDPANIPPANRPEIQELTVYWRQ
jgi:hypothetical protein